jgi:hypothetical protein
MRVRLTTGIVLQDDVWIFLPAGSIGVVSDVNAEGVDVDFASAVITGDGEDLRIVPWTAAIKPELLEVA